MHLLQNSRKQKNPTSSPGNRCWVFSVGNPLPSSSLTGLSAPYSTTTSSSIQFTRRQNSFSTVAHDAVCIQHHHHHRTRYGFKSHCGPFASNLEQVANLRCARVNSASYLTHISGAIASTQPLPLPFIIIIIFSSSSSSSNNNNSHKLTAYYIITDPSYLQILSLLNVTW